MLVSVGTQLAVGVVLQSFSFALVVSLFSKYNPLQLPLLRVGKRCPVTGSVAGNAGLVFMKHKYLLRVWI